MTTRPSHWRKDLISTPPRETTNKLLQMIEEDLISAKEVVMMCLKWMPEDDVKDMCEANEVFKDEEEE